jgi:phosphate transport system permease protein
MESDESLCRFDDEESRSPCRKNQDINKKKRFRRINPDLMPRLVLTALAVIAALIIFFIIFYIIKESIPAFREIGVWNILFGDDWYFNSNYPADPDPGMFGAKPLIAGTILVTVGSILIAVPAGVGAAIYISEIAGEKMRNVLKPVIEIFAGIPSVVYGFFGMIVLGPMFVRFFPEQFQYPTSWFLGSLILGIMALPTVISVTEDALRAVPRSYRHASVAMGATDWETIRKVVLPSASSGIIAASILGIGRAMGETMAVVMVTGSSATIPEPIYNIFSNITTLTAAIVNHMPEADPGGIQYSALFALALILLASILIVNLIANAVGKGARRKMGIGKPSGKFKGLSGFKERVLDTKIVNAVKTRKDRITSLFWFAMIFTFVTLMSTLFVSDVLSVILGTVATMSFIVTYLLLEHMNSADRQYLAYGGLKFLMVMIFVILGVIIGDIIIKGLPALSFEFIFSAPADNGESGGIWPAIVGTVQLVGLSSLIAFSVGIGAGIYLALYSKEGRFTDVVRQAVDALNGTPSIVFGLFGMSVFVLMFGWGPSLIAGAFTLALMVLPVIIKTTEESVRAVPTNLMLASMAMGSSKWQAIYKVVLPAALSGIITGLVLSLGRTAGETAPIMFTATVAFSSATSFSLFEPVMSLSYHLYYLAMEVPQAMTNTYGTALVLMGMVLSMFLLASLVRYHFSKHNRW